MHPPSSLNGTDALPAALSLVPAWANPALEASPWELADRRGRLVLRASSSGEDLCAAATVPRAAALERAAFESIVSSIYADLLGRLRCDGYHPLRFWNFIPGINEDIEPGLSRYMAFNAARYAGYRAVHAGAGALPAAIATASGVGAPDDGFHLYCVATRGRAVPVENPRQVPAYEYSPKYGPLPPCFARAMLTRAPGPLLVIGGTASVRGEDSVHADDLARQLGETLLNLRTLIRAGCSEAGLDAQGEALGAFVSLRAYVVDDGSAAWVRDALAQACGLPAGEIDVRVANLCRSDLLVEIEGVAALDRLTKRSPDGPSDPARSSREGVARVRASPPRE